MYVVSLKQFDGPLDLLLSLISDAKIDIQDIFVSEITEQYLASMRLVDELDMDAASEFLQMAATLLEIKSRRMLPKPPKIEDPDELSPEEELIRQLREYKQFKEISARMHSLEEEARDLMTKLPEEFPLPPPNIELVNLTPEKLAAAFRRVLARVEAAKELSAKASHEVRRDSFTVAGCMGYISKKLRRGSVRFEELFSDTRTREEVITMFLAMLELARLEKLSIVQEGAYEDIVLCGTSGTAGRGASS